jgi:hypothetical protein
VFSDEQLKGQAALNRRAGGEALLWRSATRVKGLGLTKRFSPFPDLEWNARAIRHQRRWLHGMAELGKCFESSAGLPAEMRLSQ